MAQPNTPTPTQLLARSKRFFYGATAAAASTIPFLLVGACRAFSVSMFENAFFAGLATRDTELVKAIRKKKAIYWDWEYVRHLMRFGLRQLGFGLVALVAKPLLGVLIPIAQFGYRIRHMEPAFLVPLFVAFILPATREAALQLVHVWLDSRAMIRELYDPIIARLKSAAKDGDPNISTDLLTDMEIDGEEYDSHAEKRDWRQSAISWPIHLVRGFCCCWTVRPELVDLSAFGSVNKKMK
ncbi:hypothetical protein AM588_10000064 [Phytophthora nicotianae]|uniref:Uncharacterized protein n=1 Tax=Phytophthora nicotianae TaxID=4792 RepID=A0A0W8C3R0_PHYNI|nr:hypothetical protein AM588_10000064 [Phytophthora nicotianae]